MKGDEKRLNLLYAGQHIDKDGIMQSLLNRIIELLKWPVALYMLISLPAFLQSFSYFNFFNLPSMAMIGGFLLFFISRGFMDTEMKTSMEIAAHEMTHAFFAFLTLHKIKSIRVNPDNDGGAMSFEGPSNWLIVIAPYFFPLFGMLVMVAISVYTHYAPSNFIVNMVMGFFIGYHADTVASQIHEKQTDLPKVGYKFCIVFLPGANLWAILSMMAFNSRGWNGFWVYQNLISQLNGRNFELASRYLSQIF